MTYEQEVAGKPDSRKFVSSLKLRAGSEPESPQRLPSYVNHGMVATWQGKRFAGLVLL